MFGRFAGVVNAAFFQILIISSLPKVLPNVIDKYSSAHISNSLESIIGCSINVTVTSTVSVDVHPPGRVIST